MAEAQFCFLWIDHWSTCLTKSEWASWVQAIFSLIAIVAAALFPLHLARRARAKTREGLFEMIAMDVLLAERQARVYLGSRIKVPAYRLPLLGYNAALPALLSDGTITRKDATALAQFYVDARSFNFCLDLAQGLKSNGGDWKGEVSRITKKAKHLVADTPASRYAAALAVVQKHLPKESLERLDVTTTADSSETDD